VRQLVIKVLKPNLNSTCTSFSCC